MQYLALENQQTNCLTHVVLEERFYEGDKDELIRQFLGTQHDDSKSDVRWN